MGLDEDFKLDFDFGPAWARTPPESSKYHKHEGTDSARPRRERPPRNPGTSRPVRPTHQPRERFRDQGTERISTTPHEERFSSVDLDVPGLYISFLPERKGLKPLVTKLARAKRAFSLMEIARMFISKPQFYAVKFEVVKEEAEPETTLFQCMECKSLFLDKNEALKHALNKHFDLYFEREVIEGEPPKGNFVCVALCGQTNELLGPPNSHMCIHKLLEIHPSRFPHMSI
ncbi:MAG: hypothetical protein GX811_04710, partial [Lentisphaerae bacterium]|nr:hypothetical protein [Lentisphaerota bacterium]